MSHFRYTIFKQRIKNDASFLIIPATTTVYFMSLKATELQLHDDLQYGGRFTHNSLVYPMCNKV
jgi:hypothetical protein